MAIGAVTMYAFLHTPQQPVQPNGNEFDSFTMR
jgi:hypothetical protein